MVVVVGFTIFKGKFDEKPFGPSQVYEVTAVLIEQLMVDVLPEQTKPELVGVTIQIIPQLVFAAPWLFALAC